MGIFDKLLGGQGSENASLSQQEAFAALLLVTIAADGHISDEEARAFNTIVNRMSLYRSQSGSEFQSMVDKLFGLLKKHGASALTEKAAAALPKELRETAFAVAVDFVFADGNVEETEKKLIETLHKSLEIPETTALNIIEVIEIKNRG